MLPLHNVQGCQLIVNGAPSKSHKCIAVLATRPLATIVLGSLDATQSEKVVLVCVFQCELALKQMKCNLSPHHVQMVLQTILYLDTFLMNLISLFAFKTAYHTFTYRG